MAVDDDTPGRTSSPDPGGGATTTTAPERPDEASGLEQTLTRSAPGDSDPGSLRGWRRSSGAGTAARGSSGAAARAW